MDEKFVQDFTRAKHVEVQICMAEQFTVSLENHSFNVNWANGVVNVPGQLQKLDWCQTIFISQILRIECADVTALLEASLEWYSGSRVIVDAVMVPDVAVVFDAFYFFPLDS